MNQKRGCILLCVYYFKELRASCSKLSYCSTRYVPFNVNTKQSKDLELKEGKFSISTHLVKSLTHLSMDDVIKPLMKQCI